MKSRILCVIIAITGLFLAGCTPENDEGTVKLQESFTLSLGQTVLIREENLQVTFIEVLEDSRCPRDVACIQAGQARCLVQFHKNDVTRNVELAEPGLNDQILWKTYLDYQVKFNLQPYPVADKTTEPDDYQLHLNIARIE